MHLGFLLGMEYNVCNPNECGVNEMMKECFKLAVRKPDAGVERFEALLGTKTAQKIRAYHKTFPMYEPTPLFI